MPTSSPCLGITAPEFLGLPLLAGWPSPGPLLRTSFLGPLLPLAGCSLLEDQVKVSKSSLQTLGVIFWALSRTKTFQLLTRPCSHLETLSPASVSPGPSPMMSSDGSLSFQSSGFSGLSQRGFGFPPLCFLPFPVGEGCNQDGVFPGGSETFLPVRFSSC